VSAHFSDGPRRMVPRWRSSTVARHMQEVRASTSREFRTGGQDRVRENVQDWQEAPSSATASDLAGAALAAGVPHLAEDAARFLLSLEDRVPEPARVVARAVLESGMHTEAGPEPSTLGRSSSVVTIRALKQRVRRFPRNALMWLDMAREYVALAQAAQAESCVRVSLALAPNSRFVLRSAARFYLHDGDPERAHRLLRNAPVTRHDPWLVAAEIATASVAGKVSRLLKPGQSMIDSGKFGTAHLSELASALASLELAEGDRGRARKLFRLALENPTDNTVAQVSWAGRQLRMLEVEPVHLSVPRTFEAQTWKRYRGLEWGATAQSAELWLADEPYASRPAILGSFVAGAVLGDYALCGRFAEQGLQANPIDVTLLNNLAFSLANQGDIDGAARALARIIPGSASQESTIAVLATEGLIRYRSGDRAAGNAKYLEAIELAERLHATESMAWALLYLAREEMLSGSANVPPILARAENVLKNARSPQREAACSLHDQLTRKTVRIQLGRAADPILDGPSARERTEVRGRSGWLRRLIAGLLRIGRARKHSPRTPTDSAA
jgi:tetratricopeptide (TPR) repeat protein